MKQKSTREKKCTVDMQFTTFEMPPSGDVLVLTKECPIGALAAQRMLDTVAPSQFELIQPEDDLIEGILIKKCHLLRVDREKLINIIIEEIKPIISPVCMISIQLDITVNITREL